MIGKQKIKVLEPEYLYTNGKTGLFYFYDKWCKNFYEPRACREEFLWDFKRWTEYIGFVKSSGSAEAFNQLINYVEKRLNLKEKTIIYRTNAPSAFIIKVPFFWREFSYRRQIFTLLLRCGAVYNTRLTIKSKNDLKNLFNRYYLTKAILIPLMYFINGNVNLKRSIDGIVDRFIMDGFVDSPIYLKRDWKKQFI